MKNILMIVQIIAALLLILAILSQSKGKGFSRGFKSGASFTRRGLEKLVYRLTFLVAFVFIVVSILQLVI